MAEEELYSELSADVCPMSMPGCENAADEKEYPCPTNPESAQDTCTNNPVTAVSATHFEPRVENAHARQRLESR